MLSKGVSGNRKLGAKKALLPLAILLSLSGNLAYGQTGSGYDPSKEAIYVQVILTEAAGESEEGQVAVGEVLRNRNWSLRGFSGINRPDLQQFLKRQDAKTVAGIKRSLLRARGGSHIAGGATHFENLEFGMPWWAKKMRVTAKIGRHTFFKEVLND